MQLYTEPTKTHRGNYIRGTSCGSLNLYVCPNYLSRLLPPDCFHDYEITATACLSFTVTQRACCCVVELAQCLSAYVFWSGGGRTKCEFAMCKQAICSEKVIRHTTLRQLSENHDVYMECRTGDNSPPVQWVAVCTRKLGLQSAVKPERRSRGVVATRHSHSTLATRGQMAASSKKVFEIFVSKIPWTVATSK